MRLIFVEDDQLLRETICELLRLDGFEVTDCGSAAAFMEKIRSNRFDVAIIDIGLPDRSGYDLARYVRTATQMGIIILTARTGIDNKIQGFSAGADYYFSKPVDCRELSATITNLIARLAAREPSPGDAPSPEGAWIFNAKGWLLTSPDGIEIRLTTKESEFIRLLLDYGDDGAKKESILEELGYLSDGPYGRRALGVMVTRLRKKIREQAGKNELINTIHGFGFSLGEPLGRF